MGTVSKLDKFLLNPQLRTCSVAVPGTSTKNASENREPTGDRFLGDRSPKGVFSACHSSNLFHSEQEEIHHSCNFIRCTFNYLIVHLSNLCNLSFLVTGRFATGPFAFIMFATTQIAITSIATRYHLQLHNYCCYTSKATTLSRTFVGHSRSQTTQSFD